MRAKILFLVIALVLVITITALLLRAPRIEEFPEIARVIVSRRKPIIKEIAHVITSSQLEPIELISLAEAKESSSKESKVELTVYTEDLGLVKDKREA